MCQVYSQWCNTILSFCYISILSPVARLHTQHFKGNHLSIFSLCSRFGRSHGACYRWSKCAMFWKFNHCPQSTNNHFRLECEQKQKEKKTNRRNCEIKGATRRKNLVILMFCKPVAATHQHQPYQHHQQHANEKAKFIFISNSCWDEFSSFFSRPQLCFSNFTFDWILLFYAVVDDNGVGDEV